MPKFTVNQRELQAYSCDALSTLAQGFRLAGRVDVALYIENLARAKGCPVTQSQGLSL